MVSKNILDAMVNKKDRCICLLSGITFNDMFQHFQLTCDTMVLRGAPASSGAEAYAMQHVGTHTFTVSMSLPGIAARRYASIDEIATYVASNWKEMFNYADGSGEPYIKCTYKAEEEGFVTDYITAPVLAKFLSCGVSDLRSIYAPNKVGTREKLSTMGII